MEVINYDLKSQKPTAPVLWVTLYRESGVMDWRLWSTRFNDNEAKNDFHTASKAYKSYDFLLVKYT